MDTHPKFQTNNKILGAISKAELASIIPKLEYVNLASGTVLYHPEETIDYVYFPNRAMISVVAFNAEGQSAEAAVIGSEGATGLDVVMGGDSSLNQHITQIPAEALRMKTADVREEFALCGGFHFELLSFTRKLIIQLSQTALCNRLHTTEKRLARWLLMCHDRSDSDELRLTQEFIALMLGANRTTVTLTAIELQNAGYIAYTRGSITIMDRTGLEAFSCSCYETISKAYADNAGS